MCHVLRHKPVAERREIVLSAKLCFQCLSNNHFKRLCKSSKCAVKDCVRKHHEFLHLPNTNDRPVTRGAQPTPSASKCDAEVQTYTSGLIPGGHRGATALVFIGADNPDAFVTEEVRPVGQQEPWRFIYSLGWALLGLARIDSSNDVGVTFYKSKSKYVCKDN